MAALIQLPLPIVDYRPAWHRACAAAGIVGRIPHDFRRTAARNLIKAGVDQLVTMALVGWEDIGMLQALQHHRRKHAQTWC